MHKRIHRKVINNISYRRYLFHFKWPLLLFVFFIFLMSLLQLNFKSLFISNELIDEELDLVTNVFYPTNFSGGNQRNFTVLYYFAQKDRLKTEDDLLSMKRKEKIIINDDSLNKKEKKSFSILEFTPVFGQPRFCSSTKNEIFGEKCPYTNW